MALRAEEEGRMVCLADLEAPEDVYRRVATASATLVREEAQSSPEALLEALKANQPKPEKETPGEYEERMVALAAKTRLAADLWLEYGIDRGVVKRNVMTFCYSSETFGFREQLMEDLMRPLSEQVLRREASHHPLEIDGDGGWFAALYLAKKNYAAVTSLVEKAAGGMKWLKRAAQLLAHEHKPVCWTTPIGFPCRNLYTEYDCVSVRLFLFDKSLVLADASVGKEIDGDLYRIVRARLAERPGEVVIKAKSASTIAPNVIHSMDATHLLLTADVASKRGINSFQFIHDSFATHAGDTEAFFWIIRETFVDMYENLDLFGYLYELVWSDLSPEGAAKLPHPPTQGSLDMDVVRKSLYSFA
jgi:DNA-directed RNA polymerase